MDINSEKSKSISKSNQSIKSQKQVESDDISLSQLELMANKKKTLKKESISKSIKESIKESASIKSSSSSTTSDSRDIKRKTREIEKENKIDKIRKEKSELLYKFNKLNIKGKLSTLKLDMNSSLNEIRNEYERIKNEMENERSVAFYKRFLLLGIQGIEMVNNKFDPLGVDLDGWSEAMGYSLENQEYDEVLSELYEKYKSTGQMSPEIKLIFMIIVSATTFTVTKKISNLDGNFKNVLSNIIGQNLNTNIPNYEQSSFPKANELNESETSDRRPSKMKGPDDGINLDNILNKMKENEDKKKEISEEFKSIPMKKKGRPKKN